MKKKRYRDVYVSNEQNNVHGRRTSDEKIEKDHLM